MPTLLVFPYLLFYLHVQSIVNFFKCTPYLEIFVFDHFNILLQRRLFRGELVFTQIRLRADLFNTMVYGYIRSKPRSRSVAVVKPRWVTASEYKL